MREQEMIGGYRLLKRLGAGGAATVWLACDEAGERVALKILHPALAADEDYRERLLREARTVNSIRGGGVAHILDIEIDATQPFVVSEYIPGPTLSELLSRGALNIGGVAAIGGALAQTLEDVHARRIIHRDVKASNVICSPRGPVLIDFGIAMGQDEARLTQTGLVSGTAGYTAPELLRGGRASAATDWWGWTATLLTALTGRPPYGEGATEGILDRVLKGEPDTRGLDPRVASFMRMALHPDPHVRPSPDQVVRELAQWGKFHLGDMAVYGGSMAWEGLNWARLLAPVTSSQAPTVVAGLSERDEGEERFASESERTSVLEPADADATRVMESGYAEDPSYVDPEATQVYPQTVADSRGWEGRSGGGETAYLPPVAPTASSMGTSYLPAEDGYRQAAIPPNVEFVTEQRHYEWQQLKTANFIGLIALAALALAPIYMGIGGLIFVGVITAIFAVLGGAYRWRENRRIRHQEVRSSDNWAALGMLPFTGLGAILSTAIGLFPGTALAWGQWVLFSRDFYAEIGWSIHSGFFATRLGNPGISWFPLVLTGQTPIQSDSWLAMNPSWVLLTWVLTTISLWGMWVMPTGRPLRTGLSVAVRVCAPRVWMQVILGLIGVLAIAVILAGNF